jgi:hypothetical protein
VPVQQREVARGHGLADAGVRGHAADRPLAVAQRVHDLQAGGFRQHREVAGDGAEHAIEFIQGFSHGAEHRTWRTARL